MVKPLVPVTEAETNCRRVWMPVRLQRRNSMKKRILSLVLCSGPMLDAAAHHRPAGAGPGFGTSSGLGR